MRAGNVTVNQKMLYGVRDELKSEIYHVEHELKSEIHRVEDELKSEIHRVEGELKSEVREVKEELKVVRLDVNKMMKKMDGFIFQADRRIYRAETLVEEANQRDKAVLESHEALNAKCDKLDEKIEEVKTWVVK